MSFASDCNPFPQHAQQQNNNNSNHEILQLLWQITGKSNININNTTLNTTQPQQQSQLPAWLGKRLNNQFNMQQQPVFPEIQQHYPFYTLDKEALLWDKMSAKALQGMVPESETMAFLQLIKANAMIITTTKKLQKITIETRSKQKSLWALSGGNTNILNANNIV